MVGHTRWRMFVQRALIVAGACMAWGCSSTPAKPERVRPLVVRDVHPALRGTVGAEVQVNGAEPVLVSGYGLVVGLNGTGGGDLPDQIAATMERQMGLMGIGKASDAGGPAVANRTPRQLLRDPNVAVVLVQGAVAPGAPKGYVFDVFVTAVNATSLEGGTLWTTDLQIGNPSVFGGYQTKRIARGRGAVFINPFADPTSRADGVTRTVGRVLSGGEVLEPFRMELQLDNASHARARAIVSAINSRFPEGPGDRGATAAGRNDQSVALRVPRAYMQKPDEFVELVKHVQIDQGAPEAYARRYGDALLAEPGLAAELSWALEALGPKALPVIRSLYDAGELGPQMSALRAGARLGDPRAAEHLLNLAERGPAAVRTGAIALLGDLPSGPTTDVRLRRLLSEPELRVRVAAYEALARRAERDQLAILIEREREKPATEARAPLSHLEVLSTLALPAESMQGIDRRVVGGKFLLDLVPEGDPLVYITQQGTPRVVVFGSGAGLLRPMLASAWENRLMLAADSESEPIRLMYTDPRLGRPEVRVVSDRLDELVEILASPRAADDPASGLGMTYSEVVGVLHAVHRAGGLRGPFATETDRLLAELMTLARTPESRERPETSKDEERVVVLDRGAPGSGERPAEAEAKPRLVPIPPKGKSQ